MAAAGRPSTSPDRTARGHPPPEACLTSMRILSPARGASLALATLLAALAPGPTAAAQPTTGSQATRRQQQRHQQPRRWACRSNIFAPEARMNAWLRSERPPAQRRASARR